MANSSNWIGALQADATGAHRELPVWLAAKSEDAAFSAVSPFKVPDDQAEPLVEAASKPAPQSPGEPAPSEAERAFNEGYAKGQAEGHEEGQRAAQLEAQNEIQHLRDVRLAFRTLDAAAIETLADDLKQTVLALCSSVIDEQASDMDALAQRCRAAAARFGEAPGALTLHLNPLDAEALGEEALAGFAIQANPGVARGGLRLAGEDRELRDGPDEWRRAIAAALGTGDRMSEA